MISAETTLTQLRRLQGLRFFPSDDKPEAQHEIARAIQTASVSDAHADAIVDAWIRGNPDAPTPADLWEMANSTRGYFSLPDSYCTECQGTGFTPVYVHVSTSKQPGHVGPWRTRRISKEEYDEIKAKGDPQEMVVEAVVPCKACRKAASA